MMHYKTHVPARFSVEDQMSEVRTIAIHVLHSYCTACMRAVVLRLTPSIVYESRLTSCLSLCESDALNTQALSSLELMGPRQRKNFLKLFRKYIKHKKDVIDWCVAMLILRSLNVAYGSLTRICDGYFAGTR